MTSHQSPGDQTTALLIRNPVARRKLDGETLARLIAIARDAGWQIDAISTTHAGHATELARDAASRGVDVIIVHGGDGTVNEAVNGILADGASSGTALAVLRGGTANVWAKETQSSNDAIASMRAIVGGRRRRVDLGRANGRYFLLMAGIGLDAAIIPRVGARTKRRLGALAYVVAGVIAAFTARATRVEMTIDGDASERSLYWMLAGNTRSYGGVVRITDRAIADDGLLDIALMRRGGPLRLLSDGARVLLRRHHGSSNIRYLRARTIEIITPNLPIQIDGELHGQTPLRIEIAPLALTVIVPADLRTPLFSLD